MTAIKDAITTLHLQILRFEKVCALMITGKKLQFGLI